MLNEIKEINGYKLKCVDGEIGTVTDFHFDDHYWTIRYLVVDTGSWLKTKKILISPYALVGIHKNNKQISVRLTKKQIEESPLLSSDKPVTRQYEESFYKYYGWPMYFNGPYMWGYYPDIVTDRDMWSDFAYDEKKWNPTLKTVIDVTGHKIEALDGDIGHIDDFIIDDKSWAIRYLVVDTHNWWAGKKVLISPQWIDTVNWNDSKVYINLSKETIKISSEYSEKSLTELEYEIGLHSNFHKVTPVTIESSERYY